MKGDVGWLRKNLAQALGWDEQLTEGVAEALAAAGSRQEVEELAQVPCRCARSLLCSSEFCRRSTQARAWLLHTLQDYLGGGDKVYSVITQFLGESKV